MFIFVSKYEDMKHIGNKFLVLGYIESYYSYQNDVTLIRASLILDINSLDLRLNFTKLHIGGDDHGSKVHLPSFNVGTLFKPKKRLTNALLRDNALRKRPFPLNGWHTDFSYNSTLTELFLDIKNKDRFIMRAIKLMKIRKAFKKKKI